MIHRVAIIDYGAGNLRSVVNAIARLGFDWTVTTDPGEALKAQAVILPGVGAAADTMRQMDASGMSQAVRRIVAEDRPFFAVCIGLQVLFETTEEGGRVRCLGLVPGKVKRFPPGLKVPHMGWNQVRQTTAHPVFDGIPDQTNFYFVHSYYCQPDDPAMVAATTQYGIDYCSMIARGNMIATQFHPEKSGEYGLQMYSNFLRRHLGTGQG